MEPVTIAVIGIVVYVLFNQSNSGQSALASVLQKLAAPPSSSSGAKPSAGSGSGGGGGSPSGSAATQAAKAAAAAAKAGSRYTDPSIINQLASDGNATDGQVAAYLAALNENDTYLADAIIGDVAPVDLESDPNSYAGYIAPEEAPMYTYNTPTTYDPGTTDSLDTASSYDDSGDSGDYGTDYGDWGWEES